MAPLVGVILSCATLVAGIPGGGAAVADVGAGPGVCALGGAACEAPPPASDAPAEYATPAEVDCRALGIENGAAASTSAAVSRADLDWVSGACSPPTLDFHYRVSRLPESERPSGALRPARARRVNRADATYTGLPTEHGTPLSLTSVQPIATVAVPALLPPAEERASFLPIARTPTRSLEPLDRPPRA